MAKSCLLAMAARGTARIIALLLVLRESPSMAAATAAADGAEGGEGGAASTLGQMSDGCPIAQGLPLNVRLNNGIDVPRLGFGTAGLGHATEKAVFRALEAGYRHIDTAQAEEWYREDAVGRALARASSNGDGGSVQSEEKEDAETDVEAALLSRREVFVTTKLHPRDFDAERSSIMVESSKRNLQTVDLLLIHSPHCWPGSCPDSPTPWQDGWRQLEKLYSEGAVRAIGVSNFSDGLLRELLQIARVVPAVVQNWMDPFHQDRAVRALCAENGIAYMAYSTLGGQWTYRPSTSSLPNPVSTDNTLGKIAEAHDMSRQAVALSWALQEGAIVLPRSSNSDRIQENLRAFVKIGYDALEESGNGDERADSGRGGRPDGEMQVCRKPHAGVASESIGVFLTDEDMGAIAQLDGTLGS